VQEFEISAFHRNWSAQIPHTFKRVTARTGMSSLYNCHGLTFASRRTSIEDTTSLQHILADDNWREVKVEDVLPGDIVLYFSTDGEANHSGIVIQFDEQLHLPVICSKWGRAGEYIHNLNDCPSIYGPIKKFYRCEL
jgi:hypothetical protein